MTRSAFILLYSFPSLATFRPPPCSYPPTKNYSLPFPVCHCFHGTPSYSPFLCFLLVHFVFHTFEATLHTRPSLVTMGTFLCLQAIAPLTIKHGWYVPICLSHILSFYCFFHSLSFSLSTCIRSLTFFYFTIMICLYLPSVPSYRPSKPKS